MKYKNLTLIGTSHISPESLKEVEEVIDAQKPDIVAIELDKKRLIGLLQKKKSKIRLRDIKRIGIKGYVFSLIGAWVEHKLGEQVGVKPGSEMLRAVKAAKKHGAMLALIDQDIEITLRRFSQELTWKEKWNFIVDLFKGAVLRKKELPFDIRKVPSQAVINKLIRKVRKRYPSIYKVLVVERNKIMAANIAGLLRAYPDKVIVAVIGAGHEKELMDLIKKELKYLKSK